MGPLGQGLLDPSGIRVVGQLKQGLVSIAPYQGYTHFGLQNTVVYTSVNTSVNTSVKTSVSFVTDEVECNLL